MRYVRLLSEVAAGVWAVREDKGRAAVDFLLFAAAGGVRSEAEVAAIVGTRTHAMDDGETAEERRARLRAAEDRATADRGGVAVLALSGIIAPRMSAEMSTSTGGGTSAEGFSRRLAAALDDGRVGGIVIDVDSPGGNVLGIDEAASALYGARGRKPIVAVANHEMCSAAYWIGASADEVVATPSAMVGSIGVYTYHDDISEALAKAGVKRTLIKAGPHKAEQSPAAPLSEDARKHLQSYADDVYGQFVAAVARGRGVPAAEVEGRFGGGRSVNARAALAAGMVDRVATLDREIARMSARLSGATAAPDTATRRRRLALA